jgi:hypothetical protein
MAVPLPVVFVAGGSGGWQIDRIDPVVGESLAPASHLTITEGARANAIPSAWALRGITGNARYANRAEINAMAARQEGLRRPQASLAALIPIRKAEAWWDLAQDERRAIFEERSRHVAISLDYLPAIARRLHHSRELGEPFDFLTWFEYAPEHSGIFEDLVGRLRQTEEWTYVEREVDVRLTRMDR